MIRQTRLDGSETAEAALAYAALLPCRIIRLLRVQPNFLGPIRADPTLWQAWQNAPEAEAIAFLGDVRTISDSKFTRVPVTMGDRIILNSAGGGGFGDPAERPRDLVAEDVKQGFISPEAAREFYGFDPETETASEEQA